jgi:hypothetical protein
MNPLALVLIYKILITILLWCVPLLTLPKRGFAALKMPVPQPMAFVRLLGAAYLALLVGYSFGLVQVRQGQYPTGVVWTGIVSNGLASGILFFYGLTGAWSTWGRISRIYMWLSALATLSITVLLLLFGPFSAARSL